MSHATRSHQLDVAARQSLPLVPMSHADDLSDLPVGEKRLLCGANGLYVEARSPALHVVAQVAQSETPYGKVRKFIRPTSAIPGVLIQQFILYAQHHAGIEVAAVIHDSPRGANLSLLTPRSNDVGHVAYDDAAVDDDNLLVDLHSHGRLDAYFSAQDNASDMSRRGPYLAIVVGNCDQSRPSVAVRLVLPPYLIDADMQDLIEHGVIA